MHPEWMTGIAVPFALWDRMGCLALKLKISWVQSASCLVPGWRDVAGVAKCASHAVQSPLSWALNPIEMIAI